MQPRAILVQELYIVAKYKISVCGNLLED